MHVAAQGPTQAQVASRSPAGERTSIHSCAAAPTQPAFPFPSAGLVFAPKRGSICCHHHHPLGYEGGYEGLLGRLVGVLLRTLLGMGTLARGPMTASPSWPGGKPQEPPASGDSLAFTQLPMELLLSIFDAYVRLSEHPEKPGRAGIRGRGKALYALTTLNWTFNRLYEPALYRHVCLMGAASTALFARGLYCPRGKARQQHVRTLILLTSWSGINPIPGTVAANYSWDVVNLLENLGPSLSHLVLSPSLLGYCSSPMRIAYRLNNVTQVHLCGWEPGVVIRLRSAMQHSFEHAADEQDPVTEVVKGLISRQQDELAEHASHQATQRHRENPVPGGPRLPPPVVRRLQHGHLLALKRIEVSS